MTDDGYLKWLSDLDQNAATLKAQGESWAAYHAGLIQAGIPAELAAVLMRDFHWLIMTKAFWPDTPPKGQPG